MLLFSRALTSMLLLSILILRAATKDEKRSAIFTSTEDDDNEDDARPSRYPKKNPRVNGVDSRWSTDTFRHGIRYNIADAPSYTNDAVRNNEVGVVKVSTVDRRKLFVSHQRPNAGKRKRNKRTHPPPLPGLTCETSMNYDKYRKWFYQAGVSLCDAATSPSQIVCASRIGRYAFFCVGYNILSLPRSKNKDIEDALKYRLKPNSNLNKLKSDIMGKFYFPYVDVPQPGSPDKYPSYRLDKNHFVAGCNPTNKWTAAALQEFLKILPDGSPLRTGMMHFNVKLYNHIKSNLKPVESKFPFTYVASGDCATGNPGHCIADPHNFLIMQKVLDKPRNNTRVLFYSGFGDNKYNDNSGVKPKKDLALIEDWFPMVAAENASEDIEGGDDSFVHFPMMGFSAMGLNGPHWRHYVDFGDCNRTSDVLLDHKKGIQKYWNIPRYNRAANRPLFNSISSSSQLSSRSWKLLWIIRTGKDRVLLNINATIIELEKTFGSFIHCETVDMGKLSYREQLEKAKGADIVVGMHGGAILQVVRWMDPDQHLVEIVPDHGPGSACFFAKMMGVPYHFNKCDDCPLTEKWNGKYYDRGKKEMGKWVGNANATQIVEVVKSILDPDFTISGGVELDCFDT